MNSKLYRELFEAYMGVYSPEEILEAKHEKEEEEEDTKKKSSKKEDEEDEEDVEEMDEEVEQINEVSADLALRASKAADIKRGKLAAAGDREGAAGKAAQAKRLYDKQAAKRLNREEVENVDELYKGKHGQSETEYQDSRSNAGKMVSGTSKLSGAAYSYRGVVNTGPNPAGGSQKPQGQGRMTSGQRTELQYRKANLKKEELDIFDIVLEFLQVEGYAETLEEAEWMMANVIDEEAIEIVIGEAQYARENPEKYEREQAKKYAPVRGEKTPMPPRGDKRREDFEKWYAKNVR
jgi:hypothetical protein